MKSMEPIFPGPDNFSPSGGLLNYQWTDTLLQMDLEEMNLTIEQQNAQAAQVGLTVYHGMSCNQIHEAANASPMTAYQCLM